MAKVTLPKLIKAINALGFAVTLTPLDSIGSAKPAASGLASRIGNDAPEVETVTVHGTTITRVVGSKSKDAPLGRDISGKALAPFGMLSDGSRPRKSPAGRPKGSEASKPAAAPKAKPATSKAKPAAPSGGFSLDLSDVFGSAPATPTPAPTPAAEPSTDDLLADLEADLAGL